jgi:hypothetical protein
MHRTLPPSEPPDGERLRYLRLAAVGGARPRGGWHPSAIARLQGFSSCSPAAFPHRWSSRMMTTSSMVGRSKPGCGLCPALSFKDLHHPCCGGGRAEPGFYLPHGPAGRLFLQHSGEKALTGLVERGELRQRGTGRPQASSAPACLARWLSWLCRGLRRCLLPPNPGVAVLLPHGRLSRRAQVGHVRGPPRVADCTGGSVILNFVYKEYREVSSCHVPYLHHKKSIHKI